MFHLGLNTLWVQKYHCKDANAFELNCVSNDFKDVGDNCKKFLSVISIQNHYINIAENDQNND